MTVFNVTFLMNDPIHLCIRGLSIILLFFRSFFEIDFLFIVLVIVCNMPLNEYAYFAVVFQQQGLNY